jgi:hypothetical protein
MMFTVLSLFFQPGHWPKGVSMSTATSSTGNNGPVHSFRKHSLKASIWRNDTRNGVMYNCTLIRTYKDGEEFKDTISLGFHDLANAAKLLLDAESWIAGQITRDKAEANGATTATPVTARRATRSSASA